MAPDKSLAAEIEAVPVETLAEAIRRQVVLLRFNEARTLDDSFDADEIELLCIRAANAVKDHVADHPADALVALQERASERSARSMRERAHAVAEASAPDCDGEIYIARKIADDIAALPLQPEGERNA